MAVESENDFRVDLHCVNPGQTTVRLSVEITDHQYQQAHMQALLQDDVTFEVRMHSRYLFPLVSNQTKTQENLCRAGHRENYYSIPFEFQLKCLYFLENC